MLRLRHSSKDRSFPQQAVGHPASPLTMLAVVMTLVATASGQYVTEEWVALYGDTANDFGFDIAVSEDGSSTVFGLTSQWLGGSLEGCYTAIKYTDSGSVDWLWYHDNLTWDGPVAMIAGPAGGYLLVGTSDDNMADFEIWAAGLSSEGDSLWTITLYPDTRGTGFQATRAASDRAGGVYVAGKVWYSGADKDYLLIRLTSDGDTVWTRTYNHPGQLASVHAIKLDPTNSVWITGSDGTLRYSPEGDLLWVDSVGAGTLLDCDSIGNLYFAWGTFGYVLTKLTPSYDTAWVKTFEDTIWPAGPTDLCVVNDSLIYVTGEIGTACYDLDGNLLWSKPDELGKMRFDANGNIYSAKAEGHSIVTRKYDDSCNVLWERAYSSPWEDDIYVYDFEVAGDSSVYLTGSVYATPGEYPSQLLTIRYSQTPFICGDVNGDQNGPDIADLVYLVSYMFGEGPDLPYPILGDINGDGNQSDIADLVYLVTYMFQSGPSPAPCN